MEEISSERKVRTAAKISRRQLNDDDSEKKFLKRAEGKSKCTSNTSINDPSYRIKSINDYKRLMGYIKRCQLQKSEFCKQDGLITISAILTNKHIIVAKDGSQITIIDKKTRKEVQNFRIKDPDTEKNLKIVSMCYNDSFVFSGSDCGIVKILDLDDPRLITPIAQFKAHHEGITSIEVDDSWIYTVSLDTKLKIWHKQPLLFNQRVLLKAEYKVSNNPVRLMGVTSRYIFTACDKPKVKIWRQQDFTEKIKIKPFAILKDHKSRIMAMDINKSQLYTGSVDRSIKIYDIEKINEEETRLITTLKSHSSPVTCLSFDDNYLYSGSVDRNVKIWDLKSVVLRKTEEPRQKLISTLKNKSAVYQILNDENHIYCNLGNCKLIGWKKHIDVDTEKEEPVKVIGDMTNTVSFVKFIKKDILLSVCFNNTMDLWKVRRSSSDARDIRVERIERFIGKYYELSKIVLQKNVLLCVSDRAILFNLVEKDDFGAYCGFKEIGDFKMKRCLLGSADFFMKNKIAYGDSRGDLTILNFAIVDNEIEAKVLSMKKTAHNTGINSINSHGDLILTGSQNSKISIWQINETNEIILKKSLINTGKIQNLKFSLDKNYVFVCCVKDVDSVINVWDLRRNVEEDIEPLKIFKLEEMKPSDIIIDENKGLLYFSTQLGYVGAFNLIKPVHIDTELIFWFKASENEFAVSSIVMSEDKSLMITASKSIKFWNFDEKQVEISQMLKNDLILLNNCKSISEKLPRAKYEEICKGMVIHMKKFYPVYKVTSRPFLEVFCSLANEEIINFYLDEIGLGRKYDELGNILRIIKLTGVRKGKEISIGNLFRKISKVNKGKKHFGKNKIKVRTGDNEDGFKKNLVKSILLILKYLTEKKMKIGSLMKDSTIYDILELSTFRNSICINFIHSYLGLYLKEEEGDHRKINVCSLDNDIQILRPQVETLLIENPKRIRRLIFYNTGFKINLSNGSADAKRLFDVIKNMSDGQIVGLKALIRHKYQSLQPYFMIQLLIQAISTIVINVFIYQESRSFTLFAISLCFVFLSIVYEFKCFLCTKNYFMFLSNFIDVFIDVGGLITLSMNYAYFEEKSTVIAYYNLGFVTALNLRTFTLLRTFKGFRYLINMILMVFVKIIYFLAIIIIFMFIHVAMLYGREQVSLSNNLDIEASDIWTKIVDSTKLSFGVINFPESSGNDQYDGFLDWIIFLPNAITIANILLNLIIAIVWDVYALFDREKVIIDLKIQIDLIREMEGFLSSWRKEEKQDRRGKDYKYFQYVVEMSKKDQEEDFNSNLIEFNKNLSNEVRNLERDIDNKIEVLEESIVDIDKSIKRRGERISERMDSIEKKLDMVLSYVGNLHNGPLPNRRSNRRNRTNTIIIVDNPRKDEDSNAGEEMKEPSIADQANEGDQSNGRIDAVKSLNDSSDSGVDDSSDISETHDLHNTSISGLVEI